MEGREQFHEEKNALPAAARELSSYFQADDTGARHLGRNAYTTMIQPAVRLVEQHHEQKRGELLEKVTGAAREVHVEHAKGLIYGHSEGFSLELMPRLAGAVGGGVGLLAATQREWDRQLAAWKFRGDGTSCRF